MSREDSKPLSGAKVSISPVLYSRYPLWKDNGVVGMDLEIPIDLLAAHEPWIRLCGTLLVISHPYYPKTAVVTSNYCSERQITLPRRTQQ